MNTSKQLRILVDLTPMASGGKNGGAKQFIIELVKHLSVIATQCDFILLCRAEVYDELFFLENNNVHCLQVWSEKKDKAIKSIIIQLLKFSIRLFSKKICRDCAILGLRVRAFMRRKFVNDIFNKVKADLLFCPFTAPNFHVDSIPTVCVVYDLQHQKFPHFFRPEELALRDVAFSDACAKATMVTTISEFSRQCILNSGKIDSDRVQLIYPRLGGRLFFSNADLNCDIFHSLRVSRQRYLIYPANFWGHKNHKKLFCAFKSACKQGLPDDIKLLCTGSPCELQDSLRLSVASFGLQERVVFSGFLSDRDLAVLISGACGMIFPSLYEGFGLPIVEAMAAGVPVACSNVSSLPEVAGGAAILFSPHSCDEIAKALLSLVVDQSIRHDCIAAGRARCVIFFDVECMAKEYWTLFQMVISECSQEK